MFPCVELSKTAQKRSSGCSSMSRNESVRMIGNEEIERITKCYWVVQRNKNNILFVIDSQKGDREIMMSGASKNDVFAIHVPLARRIKGFSRFRPR
jgi:hypothetical protein